MKSEANREAVMIEKVGSRKIELNAQTDKNDKPKSPIVAIRFPNFGKTNKSPSIYDTPVTRNEMINISPSVAVPEKIPNIESNTIDMTINLIPNAYT